MKKDFSPNWQSSKKPNKQRKFRFNAPLHIRGRFLNVHLSKELREKYGLRAVRVRVADKVKIMRGQFKKQEGKVEEVDTKHIKIFIAKIEHTKRDGTKARYPIHPSNVMITELNVDDKKRMSKIKKEEKVIKEKKVKVNDDSGSKHNKKSDSSDKSNKKDSKKSKG